MNLTIEKAQEILGINYVSRYWDGVSKDKFVAIQNHAKGFIAGWNQRGEKDAEILESKHYCTGLCFVCIKRNEILKLNADEK